MAIAALAEGTLLAHGRYRLTGVLARSNFSVTYHARDLRAGGAEVVIKEHACSEACYRDTQTAQVIAHPGQERLHRQLIERVMREAALLLEVRHPHVVRLDGAWEELGTAYCATELAPGRTLEDDVLAAADVPLDGARWARVRGIALEVLAALGAAHGRGVYHCDLKPENVLVSAARGAVLIDFGAARSEEQLLRTVTLMPFTPGYAAPELLAPARIREVGPWTDAYAWGMLVYGLAAGHPEGGAPVDAMRRLMRLSWPAVADADPYDGAAEALARRGMPAPWAHAIEACLRLDPAARPRSVAALAAMLGEAIEAGDIGVSPRASAAPAPALTLEAHTETPPPVVTTAGRDDGARSSRPGLTELDPHPRPSAPTPLPRTLPPPPGSPGAAPRPGRAARPVGRAPLAPLAVAAAALLLGGALGALFLDRPEASSAPAAPKAAERPAPPEARVAADPAEEAPAPPVTAHACEQGKFECNGRCQGLRDPSFGCGRCGPACDLANVQAHTCNAGQCAPKACDQGWDDCDRTPGNGCEADTQSDLANCGACGHACAPGPGVAAVRCELSACRLVTCAPGRVDCDNAYDNGCEIDATSDVNHCGGCGHPCAPGPHVASVRCEAKECRIGACAAPFEDRDGNFENGCEHQPAPPEPPPQPDSLPQLPPPSGPTALPPFQRGLRGQGAIGL